MTPSPPRRRYCALLWAFAGEVRPSLLPDLARGIRERLMALPAQERMTVLEHPDQLEVHVLWDGLEEDEAEATTWQVIAQLRDCVGALEPVTRVSIVHRWPQGEDPCGDVAG
jgi:hypothetical protein